MKICKEEKDLIRAYVNFLVKKSSVTVKDSSWIEHDITRVIGNNNMDYRNMVEEYIDSLLVKDSSQRV